MQLMEVTAQNLEEQHICCALSNTPAVRRSAGAKKQWMAARFAEGYHFWKLDAQGKVLIEFTRGENAWCPIQAKNWLFIDCFWVSGRFKGQGYANSLLQKALDTAKAEARLGLVALCETKKRPFLSEGGYYRHKGFVMADTAPPYYELLALPFEAGTPLPRFAQSARHPRVPGAGFAVYYTAHCPHTSMYVPLLQKVAQEQGVPLAAHKLNTVQEAQNAPNPFTTYALFYNGAFVTNEIFSPKKMQAFIQNLGAQ